MLGHAVVGSVHLSNVDAVPRIDQRIEQLKNVEAIFGGEKSFDVLKHECRRTDSRNRVREPTNERIPVIANCPGPG